MELFRTYLMVMLGGAFGVAARMWMSSALGEIFGLAFPIGTLAVNVLGSFLIGAVMHLGVTTDIFSPTQRAMLASGVLGGFTTYSSFSYETVRLLQDGAFARGALNLAVTPVVCLGACGLGMAAARAYAGG